MRKIHTTKQMGHGNWLICHTEVGKNSTKIFNKLLQGKWGLMWEYRIPGSCRYPLIGSYPRASPVAHKKESKNSRRLEKVSLSFTGLEEGRECHCGKSTKPCLVPSPLRSKSFKLLGIEQQIMSPEEHRQTRPTVTWSRFKKNLSILRKE